MKKEDIERALADVVFGEACANWTKGTMSIGPTLTLGDLERAVRKIANMRVVYQPAALAQDPIASFIGGIVERVAYKKSWHALVREAASAMIVVELRHPEPNADEWEAVNPKTALVTTPITFDIRSCDRTDGDYVRERVFNAIRSTELHEMDEWLRFDGKRVKEPHEPF